MSFYNNRDSFGQYNNYQSDSRRNSNSFSEDQTGAKRKKWSKRRGGSNSSRNANIDTPLFKEPISPRNRSQYSRGGPRDKTYSSGSYFEMRDMPDFVEPQHSGPSLHWNTYFRECKNWQDKHKLAYYRSRCLALEFENQMLFEQINSLMEENIVFAAERGEKPTMRFPDIPGRQGWQSEKGASSTQTAPKKQGKNRKSSTTSDTGTEWDYVINEAMMNYLEETIRHKLYLKKKAKEDENKKTDGDSKKKGEESKKQGPKLPMGVKRKEELEQLYGKNCALIHGLETSLQLNFNRNCDTYNLDFFNSTTKEVLVA